MPSADPVKHLLQVLSKESTSGRLLLIAKISKNDPRLYGIFSSVAANAFGLKHWMTEFSGLFSAPGGEAIPQAAIAQIASSAKGDTPIYDTLKSECVRLREIFEYRSDNPRAYNRVSSLYRIHSELQYIRILELLEQSEILLSILKKHQPKVDFESEDSARSYFDVYDNLCKSHGANTAYWYARAIVSSQSISWKAAYFVRCQKRHLTDDRLIEKSELSEIVEIIISSGYYCIEKIDSINIDHISDPEAVINLVYGFKNCVRKLPLIIPIRRTGAFGVRIADLKDYASDVFNTKLREIERIIYSSFPQQKNSVYRLWNPVPSDDIFDNIINAIRIVNEIRFTSELSANSHQSHATIFYIKKRVNNLAEFFIGSIDSFNVDSQNRIGLFIENCVRLVEDESASTIFRRRWMLAKQKKNQ